MHLNCISVQKVFSQNKMNWIKVKIGKKIFENNSSMIMVGPNRMQKNFYYLFANIRNWILFRKFLFCFWLFLGESAGFVSWNNNLVSIIFFTLFTCQLVGSIDWLIWWCYTGVRPTNQSVIKHFSILVKNPEYFDCFQLDLYIWMIGRWLVVGRFLLYRMFSFLSGLADCGFIFVPIFIICFLFFSCSFCFSFYISAHWAQIEIIKNEIC